jgi:hypothetical protein
MGRACVYGNSHYPVLETIIDNHPCYPYGNVVEGNTYTGKGNFSDVSVAQVRKQGVSLS